MLGSILLGVLLAHSTAVLPAEGQSVPKPAATLPAQEFRPGQKDGEAVAVVVNIEMTFTLKDKR